VNETLNRGQSIEIIRNAIAECLACDEAEVRPESRLVTDLGADSLDFIDLIFTLEKRFGVRIRENDLSMMTRPDISIQAGGASAEYLTPEAVSRLLPWLPELAAFPDLSRVRPVQILPLITVESLWRLVEQKKKSASA
jgi:acyl carrier protein